MSGMGRTSSDSISPLISAKTLVDLNPIGLAVPAFFGLMAIEYIWARLAGRKLFRLNDTVGDLTCGMGDQMIGLVVGVLTLGFYTFVNTRFGWVEMDSAAPLTWAFGLVGVDFCYYWFHRFSHRVNPPANAISPQEAGRLLRLLYPGEILRIHFEPGPPPYYLIKLLGSKGNIASYYMHAIDGTLLDTIPPAADTVPARQNEAQGEQR